MPLATPESSAPPSFHLQNVGTLFALVDADAGCPSTVPPATPMLVTTEKILHGATACPGQDASKTTHNSFTVVPVSQKLSIHDPHPSDLAQPYHVSSDQFVENVKKVKLKLLDKREGPNNIFKPHNDSIHMRDVTRDPAPTPTQGPSSPSGGSTSGLNVNALIISLLVVFCVCLGCYIYKQQLKACLCNPSSSSGEENVAETTRITRRHSRQDTVIDRASKTLKTGPWTRALDAANKAIMLDPSSPQGYELKHAALLKAEEYSAAIDAFEMMLSKIEQSSNPDVRQRRSQYQTPSLTRREIREVVDLTLRDSPHVVVNTTTGCLCDRAERASEFESLPIVNRLVSMMTHFIDYGWIKHEVQEYFEYVMLSHKWEDDEPLLSDVVEMSVYDLDPSPTHDKLKTFCKTVRNAGYRWAWSDTCCIDTTDRDVHQEALVAMFKWYRGSILTIVYLCGVHSPSQRGALAKSVWNTRGWTLQEYIAAKTIHFYTEDWTPYLNLRLTNHKDSLEVIAEMEQATKVPSRKLMALSPGNNDVREKLRLASTRKTERVEDAAYLLLGIFLVSGFPTIYGEGEAAIGRLLSQVLATSGDPSILAWTGESGSFNSCFPSSITVFDKSAKTHLPAYISHAKMKSEVATSYRSPRFDLRAAMDLYDRLKELSIPTFSANRMKLQCAIFQLPPLSSYRVRSGYGYRADTFAFGTVEFTTQTDLSRMKSLYLVHPWLDTLLERERVQNGVVAEGVEAYYGEESGDELSESGYSRSQPAPVTQANKENLARRLAARLRQPFGALLFTLASTGRRAADYRRVATDATISVNFQESVPLAYILENIRTIDVL